LSDAPLSAYLELAHKYFAEDDLDTAMKVVRDAFAEVGWQPGEWTEFYNELRCEYEARKTSVRRRVDDSLSIEIDRSSPPSAFGILRSAAVDAREIVRSALEVALVDPVLITVFRPDAPLDFIVGRYGYVSRKNGLDKICIPGGYWRSYPEAYATFIHEFAHVAVESIGGRAVPRWLDEGTAEYVEGTLRADRIASAAECAANYPRLADIRAIEIALGSRDLFVDDPDMVDAAYALAGSLVTWIVEKFGIARLKDVMMRIGQGDDPKRAFSRPPAVPIKRVQNEWLKSLKLSGG